MSLVARSYPFAIEATDDHKAAEGQRQFVEFAGPLFSVMISPTSSVIEVTSTMFEAHLLTNESREVQY